MQAVVQIRGEIDMAPGVEDTLDMLNLGQVNHCTLVPERDSYEGMITKINDYVAYGEPSEEAVEAILRARGEPIESDRAVDDEWVGSNTEYDDVADLASAIVAEETTLEEQGLSPTLRLHPPRGGHDGIKQPVATGGEIGRHTTEEIDELLTAMR